MDSRCDGMIDYDENIIFIELKNQITGESPKEGLNQLENTTLHTFFSHFQLLS